MDFLESGVFLGRLAPKRLLRIAETGFKRMIPHHNKFSKKVSLFLFSVVGKVVLAEFWRHTR